MSGAGERGWGASCDFPGFLWGECWVEWVRLLKFVGMKTIENKTTVFLVGFMGCGKTTLGEAFARLTGLPFVDLDDYIEREHGMSVKAIFEACGEEKFRVLEQAALRRVAAGGTGAIVACGGGTPCVPGAMELMNATGVTVWLNASVERIVERLNIPEQKAKRPLVAGRPADEVRRIVEQGLHSRAPFYGQARLTFDSSWLESEDEIAASASRLREVLDDYCRSMAK